MGQREHPVARRPGLGHEPRHRAAVLGDDDDDAVLDEANAFAQFRFQLADAHAAAIRRLEDEARRGDVNLMPAILEAVTAYATIGEMCGVLRAVYGEYKEPLAV